MAANKPLALVDAATESYPHYSLVLLITQGEHVLINEPTDGPLAGFLCLPSTKLRHGERLIESITREIAWSNLTNEYTVSELCPVNIRYLTGNSGVVQRSGAIWHVNYHGERIEHRGESGATTWQAWDKMLKDDHVLPEVSIALTRLGMGTNLPIDVTYTLKL